MTTKDDGRAGHTPTHLLMRGLFGEPMPATERGKLLWVCRKERATRAWIKPGCYAWWRYTDYLKSAQRRLLAFRKAKATGSAS